MNVALKPFVLAIVVAMTQLGSAAYAQMPRPSTTPAVQSAASKAPIQSKATQDWIIYDDTTYAPVVDDVGRHLDAARKAFDAKDNKKAAMEMHAVADALKHQADRAGKEGKKLEDADKALMASDSKIENTDKTLMASDTKLAQDTVTRMNGSAQKANMAAAAIESGTIKTKADLDKVIDKAARADMDQRWRVSESTTWYPVIEEPQRHFQDAMAAYAKKDYKGAAADIRKGASYLRLEATRASGDAKQKLAESVARLDALAALIDKATLKEEQSLVKAFAQANHALALEHRSKAAESWAHKKYDQTGYELMAAAHGLESAADWAGGEVKAGASATVKDARYLGGKLASGTTWTRDEVAKGFESLGKGIDALGQKIGTTRNAPPK